MKVLKGLKPEKVFEYFEKLCSVPHGSGNTKQISDMCIGFAKELGLRCRQDEVNNVIIWKDASAGYENAAPLILQGHMDMVCTKTADCHKDMSLEGLDLMTDGIDVWADKTSLGGDNCIAVAMALAILADDSLPHPPLEAIFTVDEEVGMDGAFAIDCSDIKGRKLLNLDSEEEGVFTVSCAGGIRADCTLPCTWEAVGNDRVYALSVNGLLGGHSGADIHKGRASANVLMARTLFMAEDSVGSVRLCSMSGGKFDNVICNSCEALVAVSTDKAPEFESYIKELDATIKNEYSSSDAGVSISVKPATAVSAVCERDSRNIFYTLFALPHGVQETSQDFEGLTQTSLSLGVINLEEDALHFSYSIRSSIASQKAMLLRKLIAIVEYAGGKVATRSGYPGWQYVKDSPLRELVSDVYREISGKDGRIEATHGGLECGLFIEKMPGLDAISIGPELRDIHSVSERLNIASTERVYRLVCETLRRSK